MGKTLAIAVIHGIGSQGDKRPADSATASFSLGLRKRVGREIGPEDFEAKIAWREIFWSDITQKNQNDFLGRISRVTRYDSVREFVVHNLSDAAGYQKTEDPKDKTYQRIHERVRETLAELEADVEPGSPLIVFAHSMGGHIMSNHIWDMTRETMKHHSPFQRMRTLAAFVTFGCNIPLFLFAYDNSDIRPIRYPGFDIPVDRREMAWWRNFYDPDDVLGFPLKYVSDAYRKLSDDGELRDERVNAGNIFTSWNPASHNGYWTDDDFYRPAAALVKRWMG